jgi:carbon-monoxide dehydrogenase medium subunit
MLPARFEYHRPETLEDALALLDQYGEDAKVLSGGMSLIPLMKLRFASFGHLVDVNRIPDLQGIREADGWLQVGGLTRHNEIASSDLVASRYPAMAKAAPMIADPIVRNLGTIGGSLAHADPAGDWGSVMLALGAQVTARSSSGERVIPVDELFVSTFSTTLEPNEILTAVQVPIPKARSGGTYLKLERKVGDFATVAAAVQLTLDDG